MSTSAGRSSRAALHGLVAVGGLADELEAVRPAEHRPRGEAEGRLIVDDQHGHDIGFHDHLGIMIVGHRSPSQGGGRCARGVATLPHPVGEVEEHGLHSSVHVDLLGQPELREDRVRVLLDGPSGQDQRGRDGGVALALGHLAEDLPLAGVSRSSSLVSGPLGRDEGLDHLRVDHRPARGHLADRGEQVVDLADPLLQEVGPALGPALEEGQRVGRVGVLAEHDHPHLGSIGPERGRDLDALVGARRRHADVRDDDVGRLRLDQRLERRDGRRPCRRDRSRPHARAAGRCPPAAACCPRPGRRGSPSAADYDDRRRTQRNVPASATWAAL